MASPDMQRTSAGTPGGASGPLGDDASEAAHREREARLALALAIGDVGTWSWDLKTGTGEIDARGAEIVGLTQGDLHDVIVAQRALIHHDDLDRVEADIAAGIASGRVFTLDYRVNHPDGTIHYVSSRAQVFADASGEPRTLLGTNRDVTAERQVETSLREREERYRTLFESMDEGFCILEIVLEDDVPVDYRFIEVNPVFERQTGLRDAVGRTARELVPGLEPLWVETYGRVALTGEPTRFTSHAPSMGRWFEVYAFRTGEAADRRVALLFNDITQRVEAEKEREEILERERMARTAAEAFLAVMSHELRTPVTSIYGRATLLARNPGREDVRELVTDMLDEAEQLRRIIDDLLVLSGIDRGHLPLTPEPILVQHAIGEVLADARRRFPQVVFKTALRPGVPPVTADSTALRQVLYNLVSNAAKYAGMDGPVTIEVTEAAETVDVGVLDEGPGVGDDPDALFTLFFRSPHTSKRASGTGIGLYVARELLRAMDATIEAATRPTGGASFRVRLQKASED